MPAERKNWTTAADVLVQLQRTADVHGGVLPLEEENGMRGCLSERRVASSNGRLLANERGDAELGGEARRVRIEGSDPAELEGFRVNQLLSL